MLYTTLYNNDNSNNNKQTKNKKVKYHCVNDNLGKNRKGKFKDLLSFIVSLYMYLLLGATHALAAALTGSNRLLLMVLSLPHAYNRLKIVHTLCYRGGLFFPLS